MSPDSVSPPIDVNAILRTMFVGATVNGLRFGALQLLFDKVDIVGEPCLTLASTWRVYDARPAEVPSLDPDTEEDPEAEIRRAIALRHKEVADVEVLQPWPHLLMTFTDGSVLCVNGRDDRGEPWTALLAHAPAHRRMEVIACPGGELAFLLPRREG